MPFSNQRERSAIFQSSLLNGCVLSLSSPPVLFLDSKPGSCTMSFQSFLKLTEEGVLFMGYQFLRLEKEDQIALLEIHRPEKLNALNYETISELFEALEEIRADSSLRALILTGAGDKAFVAGADIQELAKLTPLEGKKLSQRGQKLTREIENFPKPVIAAINGYALGGGLEIALACHIRIASQKAKLALPEVTLGIIPGYGGTQRLPKLIGLGRALEMILSGKMISAEEALQIGLVNQVTSPEELLPKAKELAQSMVKNAPLALQFALEATLRGYEATFEEGLAIESDLFGLVCATEDMKEGTKAFLEKREAKFQGR